MHHNHFFSPSLSLDIVKKPVCGVGYQIFYLPITQFQTGQNRKVYKIVVLCVCIIIIFSHHHSVWILLKKPVCGVGYQIFYLPITQFQTGQNRKVYEIVVLCVCIIIIFSHHQSVWILLKNQSAVWGIKSFAFLALNFKKGENLKVYEIVVLCVCIIIIFSH